MTGRSGRAVWIDWGGVNDFATWQSRRANWSLNGLRRRGEWLNDRAQWTGCLDRLRRGEWLRDLAEQKGKLEFEWIEEEERWMIEWPGAVDGLFGWIEEGWMTSRLGRAEGQIGVWMDWGGGEVNDWMTGRSGRAVWMDWGGVKYLINCDHHNVLLHLSTLIINYWVHYDGHNN